MHFQLAADRNVFRFLSYLYPSQIVEPFLPVGGPFAVNPDSSLLIFSFSFSLFLFFSTGSVPISLFVDPSGFGYIYTMAGTRSQGLRSITERTRFFFSFRSFFRSSINVSLSYKSRRSRGAIEACYDVL